MKDLKMKLLDGMAVVLLLGIRVFQQPIYTCVALFCTSCVCFIQGITQEDTTWVKGVSICFGFLFLTLFVLNLSQAI